MYDLSIVRQCSAAIQVPGSKYGTPEVALQMNIKAASSTLS